MSFDDNDRVNNKKGRSSEGGQYKYIVFPFTWNLPETFAPPVWRDDVRRDPEASD
ncbi:MAG: hypothetical protein KGY70_12725 [Bacteroidales bacterium]|nr:hypothetical protein [Bacteroidales bacterium]